MYSIPESVRAFLNGPKKHWIGGEWVEAASGRTFPVYNPSTGDILTEAARGDGADVDRAVQAARQAFEHGAWPRLTPYERGQLLYKLADVIEQHAEELAILESLDNGKPIRDARRIDIPAAIRHFRYYAGWANKIAGDTLAHSQRGNYLAYTVREPVGVVGQIIPWNFPLLMAAWKLAPALACGNTVVLKPAEQTPLTALRLAELAKEAGFPPGVINIVTGYGEEAGAALVAHSDVDKVAFTGSTAVGQEILRQSAGNLKKVSLELGGKSPNVIFADADLKRAIPNAFFGLFYNQGQVCVAGSRLFVEKSIADQVIEGLVQMAKQMKIGPSLDPETQFGPVVSQEHLERIESYIALGKQEGAQLALEGGRLSELGDGYFISPTIFTNVDNRMRIAQEEIFGPVLGVQVFEDVEEVIQRCNDTIYGLAAGVWTSNLRTAQLMSRRLKAGTVWVNCYNVMDDAVPFGGYKFSGIGREMGSYALDLYTQVKSVWVNYD
ncbi:MAG: betaine-aldehyde dehydrogenase [Bacillaceae bacterium G1]|nr:betaine-aldehyde dehydrogenase [Bacillota bacterium]OJF17132.1 MAG: betaine-aldehyde dehydrogenase [Bacillaceae bacterium G1]